MRLCNPVVRLAIPGNDYGIYIQLYRIGPNNNVCPLKRISKFRWHPAHLPRLPEGCPYSPYRSNGKNVTCYPYWIHSLIL